MLVGVNLAAAATAHISPDAAARFLMTSFNSGAGQLFTYLYFVSEYTAPVVMGFALWRSRSVRRWLAVLFTVGLEAAEAQSSKGAAEPPGFRRRMALSLAMRPENAWTEFPPSPGSTPA